MAKDIKSSVERIQRAKTDIASAIAGKGVTVPDGTKIDGMPELISHIESGGIDTSDATATADNIEYGKTAYTANGKEAGTLNKTSRLASTKTSVTAGQKTPMVGSPYYIIGVSADELTAPSSAGRYIIDAAKLNVSMDVNASVFGDAAASNVLKGKTFTSSAGLAVNGTHVCKQPNLQTKSVAPSAAAQTVQPDTGYDGLSSVAVAGDANLIPANIKKNTKIFGVTGEMETGIDTSDATATENDIVGGVFAYAKGKKIAGALSTIMSYPTTPSFVDEQIRFPYSDSRSIVDSGSFFYSTASKFGDATASDVAKGKTFTSAAGVSVVGTREAESGGIDTSDATATANDIAQGKTAYVNGEKVNGTISTASNIANTGAVVKQIRKTPVVGSGYYVIEMQATGTTAPGGGKYIFDGESTEISLDVNSSKFGNATAENVLKGKTFTSSAGLAVAGTHECPAPKLHEKQITPSAAAKTYYPDEGYDGVSKISVVGDPDLSPENIVYGKQVFDVVGSHKCPTFTTQKKTVTPSAQAQTIKPDSGYDGLSSVAVAGDANLIAENIKKDTTIFGVTGTLDTPSGGTDTSDATATADDIAKDKTAYVNGEKITGTAYDHLVNGDVSPVNLTVLGNKSIGLKATTSGACHLAKGTSVSLSMDADKWGTAAVTDVLKGKTFTSQNGVKIAGTYEPPNTKPSLQVKSVTPAATAQTVTPDTGYDGLSQVTVSGDTNLTAGNIKKGVNIFGVAGTYEAAASGGNGNNNCEAYEIDVTNPTVNFKTASGTIKVYGYAYATSSSGWGGSSTTVHAFCGDGYYTAASWGSPSKTSCTFGVSNGKLTGLPTLNGGTLLVVRGI